MIESEALKRKIANCLEAKLAQLRDCFNYGYALDQIDDEMVGKFKAMVMELVMERGDWQTEDVLDEYDPEPDVEYEMASALRCWYENQEE